MASMNVGTVCMKVSGREAGAICCIVKPVDKAFVMVTGPKLVTGIKRRRCNIAHLEPVGMFLDIKEDSSDDEIMEAYKKAGITTKFNLKLPSAADVKSHKEKSAKKEETKKEAKKETKTEKK